jgi:hypothetical protein
VNDRGLSGPSAEAECSAARRGPSALRRHLRSRLRSVPGAGMPGMGLMPAPSPRPASDPGNRPAGPETITASGAGSRAPSEDRRRPARHRPSSELRQRRRGRPTGLWRRRGGPTAGGVRSDRRSIRARVLPITGGAVLSRPGRVLVGDLAASRRVIRIQGRQGKNAHAPSSRTDRSSGAGSARPYLYVIQRPARTGAP